MRKLVLLAMLLFPSLAFAQGGSITGGGITVLSASGRPIGGATITICAFGASGIPCSPTITVYTSPALSVTAANPGVTDGNGNLFVYAAPGRYTYTITGNGITGTSLTATVAGSGGGDVILSGNNAFTGNNTFSGTFDAGKDNSIFWAGSTLYPTCQSAITAAGTVNKSIVAIRSDYAGAACPATFSENITMFSYDGVDRCNVLTSTPPCSNMLFNNDDTVVYATTKHELTTNHQDLNGVSLSLYAITTLKSATASGTSGIDGMSAEANTAGVLSGTFNALQAHEADVTVRSTGGTITAATGGVFYYNSDVGATTAVTNVYGIRALGCNTVLGTAPTNCYGAWFSRQDAGGVGKASTRNYSFASEGPGLMLYNSGLGASYLDWEDAAHVTRHAIYGDASNNFNIQAINAAGISLLDSGAVVRATLTSAGLKVATGFTPTTAAGIGLGTNALPFSNICLGTAATNNLCTNVAATVAARTLNVPDPLGTVSMPYVIASGTTTLTANAALAAVTSQAANTTAATGVLTTDAIEWSYATAPTAGDSLCHVSPYVTAGNVNFVRTNPTAAAQNVSALVINWRVIR